MFSRQRGELMLFKYLALPFALAGFAVAASAQEKVPAHKPLSSSKALLMSSIAADADCDDLTNPVYFPATTLLESFLSKVAPVLADSSIMGADQMTIIHFPLSSCITYDIHKDQVALTGTGIFYLPDGTQQTCDMPVGSTITSDLSAMDVGGVTCLGGQTPPTNLKEYPSHVETLGFIVPRNSSQSAITATEGYYLMKFGGEADKQVAPWTDPNFVMVRNPGSSTQLTIGANVGIPGTMWSGNLNDHAGSSDVRDEVIAENTTGNAEKVIGILNSSKWEAASDNLKVLAFQPFNQCIGAVFPDSTATARDKANVRDGHYPIWTNLRYILRTDDNDMAISANGAAAATRAQRFVDLMTGTASIDNLEVANAVVETGNIPACAMHVKRDIDGGDISTFEHPAPCDCLFLEGNGIDSQCATCDDSTPCASGVCRSGFCEAR